MRLRAVDLFAGSGGMSLGFENAGIEIVAAFDNWAPAVATYESNFSHPIHQIDIALPEVLHMVRALEPSLIVGGPPCQDFSIAGKRATDGTRANLTKTFAEIVCEVRPRGFVMENVAAIRGTAALEVALEMFRAAGYGVSCVVLDASYVGVPQARKRFFAVGILGTVDDDLKEDLERRTAQTPMTMRQFFGDSLQTEFYYAHPRSYRRRAVFSIDEPSATIRGVNRPIPKTYVSHPADKSRDLQRVRPLNTDERALAQTFPAAFKFVGTQAQREQQIGNAVPVALAEHVANVILKRFQ